MLHLGADRFAMYGLEEFFDEIGRHTECLSLGTTMGKNRIVSAGLQHGHRVLFFELCDIFGHSHAVGQDIQELIVYPIDLAAEVSQVFGGAVFSHDDITQYFIQSFGCDLLFGIRPCLVGLAMALDNQTVEAHIHGLLAQGLNKVAIAAHMAGIAQNR